MVNAPAARRIEAMQRCSALRLAHAALVRLGIVGYLARRQI
jgi:hypothetical protein